MGKILCYVYEEMADFEITLLLHRLRGAGGREIVSISEDTGPITAQSGLQFLPDRRIQEIDSLEDVEALILPGGPINNEQNEICPLVSELAGRGVLVAAICFAPQFLGRAGLLRQYKFTTSCSPEKIREQGCEDPFFWENYVPRRTVVDRNVITAQGYAFVDFAAEVCRYLHVFADEQQEYELLGRVKEDDPEI